MALGLAMALAVAVTQLLVSALHQRRLAIQYAVAAQETSNLVENLVSQSWADTTTERLAKVELSPDCRRWLPDARLHVQAFEEAPDIRRIGVQISWRQSPDARGDSLQLSGWQFRNPEAQR